MRSVDAFIHKHHGGLNDSPPGGNSGTSAPVLFGDVPPDVLSNDKTSHQGTGGTSGTTTSSSLPAEPASPTPFTININWDSGVASAPAGFTSDVLAAVQYLETQFVNPATVTIDVGYNEVDGGALAGGDIGESLTYLDPVSYASLVGAVAVDATTATDASVAASLPTTTSPVSGGNYWVTAAESEALGLTASNTSLSGYVGFGTASEFTYGDTATSGTVAPGTYDFFATAVHEITEVMGRQMLTGKTIGSTGNSYSLMDLLHYSSPGTRDFSASTAGYFSPDGGTTNLGQFNTVSGGDAGDWSSSVTDDSFDAYSNSAVVNAVSANDLTLVDALGWTPTGSGGTRPPPPLPPPPIVPISTPTGVSVSAVESSLLSAQGSSGLSKGAQLAQFSQVGGLSGDSYSYTLGGAGAAAFSLSTSNSAATLSAGQAAGAANGELYAVTVTTTDTASGSSSPAVPVNVVVGSSGSDIVNLASMSGISPAAPTFIYGLGGNDTVNGTGMTGKLYFDVGTGADVMTGGSGVNVYEYGAASDSTKSLMDIITNFNPAADLIDLSQIGNAFKSISALSSSATNIAGHSIGWQTSGGNTFVYVNTGSKPEALTSTNMKIELFGSVALTSADFRHH